MSPDPPRRRRPSSTSTESRRPVHWRTIQTWYSRYEELYAANCFTVELLTLTGRVRHKRAVRLGRSIRRVKIASVARIPDGAWMKQVVRNLTDADGFLLSARYLIVDRDPLLAGEVR